jgi:acetyltransferase
VAEAAAQARTGKPVLAAWMGGQEVQAGIQLLNQAHLPTYTTPDQAVRAFMYLVSYARNLEILHETPRDVPLSFTLDRAKQAAQAGALLTEGRELLSESESKSLLEAYGIAVIRPYPAQSAEEAIAISRRIGYPVVLKIASPQISHKTDVGGVALDLQTDDEVRAAFERIVRSVREKRPDVAVTGVTVQRMVNTRRGFELIVGTKQDPTFGAVILVGMGGIAAEVFNDRALGLPPLNERLARRMLESLKSWPLLKGYRGNPGVNLDQLIEGLMRFSYLVAEHPEIKELDINPLLATADEVVALDARTILDQQRLHQRPYAHLAIRPYPNEFTWQAALSDGTPITVRPIKPEDEPLWHAMFSVCSPDTIRFRFRYLFKETTHEMAARFCFIDYDRELALVAELEEAGVRKLIGSVWLVATADREEAEYAVLVADPWQGRGLGEVLTRYALEIARRWGLKRLIAETTADNTRMLAIFRRHKFQVQHTVGNEVMLSKSLAEDGDGGKA